ncbi:hypothetical protein LTR86_006291 [Recurvomyces mirabilis]|nr:hypothetical protein LTR86_006291 [Recurvomyces mirabilis]
MSSSPAPRPRNHDTMSKPAPRPLSLMHKLVNKLKAAEGPAPEKPDLNGDAADKLSDSDRLITKQTILHWISADSVLRALETFKRTEIDHPDRYDALGIILSEYRDVDKLERKIKFLSQHCASNGRLGEGSTDKSRLFGRWSHCAFMVLFTKYPVPGSDLTGSLQNEEWRWRAAWSLLFTVVMELHRNETGYLHQLLRGPKVWSVEKRPAKLILGMPANYFVPKVVVKDLDPEDLGAKLDSGDSGSDKEEAFRKPRRVTCRRSKRGGKANRKTLAKRAARQAQMQNDLEHTDAKDEKLPGYYRRDCSAIKRGQVANDKATFPPTMSDDTLVDSLSEDGSSLFIPATAYEKRFYGSTTCD